MNFSKLTLDYAAEFLRGWPMDGGLELDYPIDAGQQLAIGDLVKTVVVAGVTKVTKTVAGDATAAIGRRAGIVVRGNADEKSSAEIGKSVILWGNYIVSTTKFDTANITAAGVNVVAGADGKFVPASTATEDSLGHVIEYRAAAGGRPAEIVVVVK